MAATDRIDLNALLSFAAVAEAGGFTAAADRLGVSKARVSLDIARLERQLGASLLHRTTRRVALSEAGAQVYAGCVQPLREVGDALAQLGNRSAALSGSLRIACTVDHAVQSMARLVAQFSALHPQLQIELRTSDRLSDLVAEGIGVAFRLGWLRDSTLRATKLADFEQRLVAAPAYLARAGRPRTPPALAKHEWLALGLLAAPLTWRFTSADGSEQTVRMKSRIKVDSAAALRALLESGAGVSVLDAFSADAAIAAGRLVHLLPKWSLPRGGLYAVYPPGRQVPAAVRAFVEFCVAEMKLKRPL